MIKIRDLKIRLGKKQVLNGVDLDIPTGKTVVVMGRSGTGKSVLFKNIIGLMHPDSGSIEVDGQEVVGLREKDLNEVRKRFGVLFQSGALFDSMTVGENV
ncbi:MAG: ATP-binding cassette domain-containing protein, partial [Candidatus Eisenbacteria bacterium]|nr:ATP-binding cassette domain-containing protein [Candidatus Eisenbacteria bacterium]